MGLHKNQQAFFTLVRAGLWEKDVRLLPYGEVDYSEVMTLAQKQAVVGLVAAGLEHLTDVKVPRVWALQFAGSALQIEKRSKAMKEFVSKLIGMLRDSDIYALLIKGLGVAQCYDRPLWRSPGDVDLLLSDDNYDKAKGVFVPLSSGGIPERLYSKELGLNIDEWLVELHGTQRTGLSTIIDKEIDATQRDLFFNDNVRSWDNNGTLIFMPAPVSDVFIVFTHYIKHFYKEGMNLRQVCDWCRLLWKFRDEIDQSVLERRVRKAGLMAEWKAFAAVAVDYLGMPAEVMPFYSVNKRWSRKADKIMTFVLKEGKWNKWLDTLIAGSIFPFSVLRFAPGILLNVNWLKMKERLFRNND